MTLHGVNLPEADISALCRRYGVRRLWVFGSILGPHFRSDSDVDFLVESDPVKPAGLLALGGLQMDLTDLIGRTVHLTTLGGVPDAARPGLISGAQLQYAA